MMKKQRMETDELEYVGLIRDAISYKEDIMTMQVSFYTLIY
jgi:hypothetical protein